MKQRGKRKLLARLAALTLALTALLGVQTAAWGADTLEVNIETKGTFTVNGLDASTENPVDVSAYRIIEVNIDTEGQPVSPMYRWVDSVATWLKTNVSYKEYVGEDNEVLAEGLAEGKNPQAKKLLEDIAAAIKAKEINLTPTATQTVTKKSVTFSNMPMGEYLLLAQGEKSAVIYQPTAVALTPVYENGTWVLKDISVMMKYSKPAIDKEVAEPEDGTVAVGDTVTYKLKVTVPSYPEGALYKKFQVGDTMGKGLTFDGADSIEVYAGTDTAGTPLDNTGNKLYTVELAKTAGDPTFVIDFEYDTLTDALKGETTITVVYTAMVNADAVTEGDPLKNTAHLVYNNDPFTDDDYKTEDEKKVYTYGIQLEKRDKKNKELLLAGAVFTLTKKEETEPLTFTGSDGSYIYNPKETVTELTVSSEGRLELKGLDTGTYILKEVQAPGGYILPEGFITVTITDEKGSGAEPGPDGVIDGTKNAVVATDVEIGDEVKTNGNKISLIVYNEKADGFILPTTGGMGTLLFTAGGIFLMGCAVMLAVALTKKKRREE